MLVLSHAYLTSALRSKCVPASVSVVLCCLHVACTVPLLLCPHPTASMYFRVTFVARGKQTGLFSCLHAPYLWPQFSLLAMYSTKIKSSQGYRCATGEKVPFLSDKEKFQDRRGGLLSLTLPFPCFSLHSLTARRRFVWQR